MLCFVMTGSAASTSELVCPDEGVAAADVLGARQHATDGTLHKTTTGIVMELLGAR